MFFCCLGEIFYHLFYDFSEGKEEYVPQDGLTIKALLVHYSLNKGASNLGAKYANLAFFINLAPLASLACFTSFTSLTSLACFTSLTS